MENEDEDLQPLYCSLRIHIATSSCPISIETPLKVSLADEKSLSIGPFPNLDSISIELW